MFTDKRADFVIGEALTGDASGARRSRDRRSLHTLAQSLTAQVVIVLDRRTQQECRDAGVE
jgi:hypothetical protein